MSAAEIVPFAWTGLDIAPEVSVATERGGSAGSGLSCSVHYRLGDVTDHSLLLVPEANPIEPSWPPPCRATLLFTFEKIEGPTSPFHSLRIERRVLQRRAFEMD